MTFFYDDGWVDYHCDDEPCPAPFRWVEGTHYTAPPIGYEPYGIDGLEFA